MGITNWTSPNTSESPKSQGKDVLEGQVKVASSVAEKIGFFLDKRIGGRYGERWPAIAAIGAGVSMLGAGATWPAIAAGMTAAAIGPLIFNVRYTGRNAQKRTS
jgi:hypothetical protein